MQNKLQKVLEVKGFSRRFRFLSKGFENFRLFFFFFLLDINFFLSVCFSVTKLTLDTVHSAHGHKKLYPSLNKEASEKGPGVSLHPSRDQPSHGPRVIQRGNWHGRGRRIQFSGQEDHSTSCSVNAEACAALQSRERQIQNRLRSNITLIH